MRCGRFGVPVIGSWVELDTLESFEYKAALVECDAARSITLMPLSRLDHRFR